MAFCPSLLLLRAAVVTLPPTLARKPSVPIRSSQSAAVGEFSLGSPRSLRSKNFSLDLREFRNLRKAGFEVGRRGSTSRPRCVSSSSSSSASTPMAADAEARATKAEDSVMESASGNSVVGTAGNGSPSDREGLSACEEKTPKYAVVNNETSSSGARGATLEELKWDHTFVDELPGDTRMGGPVRQVLHACYTKVAPSAIVKDPQLVSWSEPVAQILGIDPKEFERPDFPHFFSGEKILQGSFPYAQCYGGHQFGMWAGQLGDGRAITLGEILDRNGSRWELQLKGSGKTPYSRMADGLAVLRSSVREFLCSEAVHHLGIPTTRALSLVMTGASVERDMFYDGHPKLEPGAVVCRVAPSFLRFGSYQIHAARSQDDIQIVQQLADYTIKHHFEQYSDLGFERQGLDSSSTEEASDSTPDVDITKNKYAAWFADAAERTAVMIAKWQGVGFTHGVMNTDNMSILGLTIDYGPFGFLDAFDPKFTPNTTDLPGRRYCFANQPDIGLWNTVQLANTLHAADLISTKEAQYCLGRYADKFMEEYRRLMSQKMGLKVYNKDLLTRLLNNLATDKVDYTNFFRVLANVSSSLEVSDDQIWLPLKPAVLDLSTDRKKVWVEWLRKYTAQLSEEGISDPERKASMNKVNPKYILRNYLCQTAIDQAEIGDFGEVHRLLKLLERPYDEQPGMEKYARLPPAWAYRPGVCMLSCSS